MQETINCQSMLKVGTILRGIYRIDSYLSSGGFGNTYVATNIEFDERVAIKEFFMKGVTQRDDNQTTVSVSNSENIDSFQQQKEKFKKEARRIRQLKNEHIVAVHDLFEENGTAYYVMDYVDGENLAERLKRIGRPMTEQEVNEILPQILDALKAVHDEGFCHLDIKPSNIMLEKGSVVKLIDFGASKQLGTNGTLTTNAPTAFAQTPGFAPREQMEQNFDKIGSWTDIYALGATLYNLFTNKRPPLPTDIDDDGTEDKHIVLPFPEGVSDGMKSLVLQMINTNRMQRPQNIDAIIEVKKSKKEGTVHTPKQQPSAKNTTSADDESTVIAEPQPPKREKKSEPKPESESKAKPQVPGQPISQGGNNGKDDNGYLIFARTAAAIIVVVTIVICILAGSYSNNDNDAVVEKPISVVTNETSTEKNRHFEENYDNGSSYKGNKNGYFEESYDDGSSYKGNFKDGLYHDWGTYIWANGNKYEGKWNKGNMVKGTFTWPEKRKNYMYKYVGEFKNNKREGEGTAYYVGGETQSGLWKNGEFVESQPTSIPDINDFATSKECYERAKELRHNGLGEKAIEFCLKAYRIGESPYNGWALHQIGCIYYFGLGGIKNNYYEGFRYFKMASDIGVLPSKYYLGICYRYGRGVQQDGSKAKELISASGYTSPPGYDF